MIRLLFIFLAILSWIVPNVPAQTIAPIIAPTIIPTIIPTMAPTRTPTRIPTIIPTAVPTVKPTAPSNEPSSQPSSLPSGQPSSQPSSQPSRQPTSKPSYQPTSRPSSQPTIQPSNQPSSQPTSLPSTEPSRQPTSTPTSQPISRPTSQPSNKPTMRPSSQPSSQPSSRPSNQPTSCPSRQPTSQPTNRPTNQPSSQPSDQPSRQPTSEPSAQPSGQPTSQPSSSPSGQPTLIPSLFPSGQPSRRPSSQPSTTPSSSPSGQPTSIPTSLPTPLDLVTVNPFDTGWDKEYIEEKTQYYLAFNISYFIIIFLIFLFVDKSQICKSFVDKLQLSSYNSKVYEPVYDDETDFHSNIKMIDKAFFKENSLLASVKQLKHSGSVIIESGSQDDVVNPIQGNVGKLESTKEMKGGIWPVFSQTKLSSMYYYYVGQKRCYLGCSPILFPNGINWNFAGFAILSIHPGVLENFIYYSFINNPILSCMFCIKYALVSRNGRRIVYIISNCLTFFIQAFTASIFDFYGDSVILSNAFDVLVVSPLVTQIEEVVLFVYLLRNIGVNGRSIIRYLQLLRSIILSAMFLLSLVSILFSSLFAYNSNNLAILKSFFLYVQLPSFVYQIIVTMLRFVSTYHFLIYIRIFGRSLTLLNIGEYYIEKLLRIRALEGKDYITQEYNIFFNMMVCNYVIDKKYADLYGLQKLTLAPTVDAKYETEADVESASRYSIIYNDKNIISYNRKYSINAVVNTIAEDIKLELNNDDVFDSTKVDGGDYDATSNIAMEEIYKNNDSDDLNSVDRNDEVNIEAYSDKPNDMALSSNHSKFLNELRGSAHFMRRSVESGATINPAQTNINPMHSLKELFPSCDEETGNEQATYRDSTSRNSMSYDEWFATKRGQKIDSKRKSFVKVLNKWEALGSRGSTISVAEKIMESTKRTKSSILLSKRSSTDTLPGPK